MNLNDLLEKPLDNLTDEQLEDRLHLLKRLKLKVEGKKRVLRSNKEKSIQDVLKGLSKEELANLIKQLKKGG